MTSRVTGLVWTTLVGALMVASGCAHTVRIDSSPPGADVSVDGEPRGRAPVTLDAPAGFFDSKKIRIELDGYAPLETEIVQQEFNWPIIIPAVCGAPFTLFISCAALSWATRYPESYDFRLSPLGKNGESPPPVNDERILDPEATYPY